MDVVEFGNNYLNVLLNNISRKEKSIFLLILDNLNIKNYDDHRPRSDFLDLLASSLFLSCIPTN